MTAPETCPGCGGLVAGNPYGVTLIQPPAFLNFRICRTCEATLKGQDRAAHDALIAAFAALAGRDDANAVH